MQRPRRLDQESGEHLHPPGAALPPKHPRERRETFCIGRVDVLRLSQQLPVCTCSIRSTNTWINSLTSYPTMVAPMILSVPSSITIS